MTRAQKNRLQEFLLDTFLFTFFRKTSITVNQGRRYLTGGNTQVIASEFIGWCRRLDEVLQSSRPVEVLDALQAIRPNSSGRSEKLTDRIARGATYPRGLTPSPDMEISDVGNPMLGPELTGSVSKEDIRVLFAQLEKPWHL